MCGISGIVYWDQRPVAKQQLVAALDAQSHRGPDERGVWVAPGCGLAHNRLTIIDTTTGQQPMVSQDGRFALVYNGEVYNFQDLRRELEGLGARFVSASDTEVVLAAYAQWGPNCVARLRGMFGFAVWDTAERSLFLARDRMGIKPLVYCCTPAFTAFASELQGLLSLADIDRTMDLEALDLYLHYQYVPDPWTIYRQVRKLSPAHTLLLHPGAVQAKPTRYWDVDFTPDTSLSEQEWLEQLDVTISESVRLHLVSDVPFGAFLSGGIDSSVVVAHMGRHLESPVHSFTIGFEHAEYDESRFARQAAEHVGARHFEERVTLDTANLLDEFIHTLAAHYGEPFADSSAIPTYHVSRLAASQVKMVLSGDGGDELFAGYNTYPAMLDPGRKTPGRLTRLVARWRGHGANDVVRAAQGRPDPAVLQRQAAVYAYFPDALRRQLYRPEYSSACVPHHEQGPFRERFLAASSTEQLGALQYLDLKTYLCGDILAKVDIASMAHSLEVRVPLLDHVVVETAARVPAKFKLRDADGSVEKKYLLKRHAATLYPPGFFERPKQGFGVPIDHWLSGELHAQAAQRIMHNAGVLHELFDESQRQALVADPVAARNNAPRIWALLFLQAWAEQSRVALP